MKRFNFFILMLIAISGCKQTQESFINSKDAYFGLEAPGLTPEVFAPGIVSDSNWAEHCQVAISPKGDEIYWSAWSSKYPPKDTMYGSNSEQIYFSKFKKGKWTKPALAEFVKEHLGLLNGCPVFSLDGERLYFYSVDRPKGLGEMDVWYVERENNKWGKAKNVGKPFNSKNGDWTPFFTKKGHAFHMGNYYFNKNEKPLMYTYKDGKFLDSAIVELHKDYVPIYSMYVSPDEEYLIFSGIHRPSRSTRKSLDLFISFKNNDETWGEPIRMGDDINTEMGERFPVVSPDGKYLFFMRHTKPSQDIFWVSTDVIEKLKTENQTALD